MRLRFLNCYNVWSELTIVIPALMDLESYMGTLFVLVQTWATLFCPVDT